MNDVKNKVFSEIQTYLAKHHVKAYKAWKDAKAKPAEVKENVDANGVSDASKAEG